MKIRKDKDSKDTINLIKNILEKNNIIVVENDYLINCELLYSTRVEIKNLPYIDPNEIKGLESYSFIID